MVLKKYPKRLNWNPAAEEVFSHLKQAFTFTPMLKNPNPSQPFIVDMEATDIRAILSLVHGESHKLHPVAYFSKKTLTEHNYDVGGQELGGGSNTAIRHIHEPQEPRISQNR